MDMTDLSEPQSGTPSEWCLVRGRAGGPPERQAVQPAAWQAPAGMPITTLSSESRRISQNPGDKDKPHRVDSWQL
jgi:hypothetical protein